jgi:hypothetical protein
MIFIGLEQRNLDLHLLALSLTGQHREIESFEFEPKDVFILYGQIHLVNFLLAIIGKGELDLGKLSLVMLVVVFDLDIQDTRWL